MGKIKTIAERVFQVGGAGLSNGSDCLVYALDLGEPVLIDCGCGPSWPRIRSNMINAGLDPDQLHTLVLTHAHVDHIGAAARIASESGCKVVAHTLDADAIESGDPSRTAADWYGIRLSPMRVDERMNGATHSLPFSRGVLQLLHTPGHTPGSIVAWLDTAEGRVLFGQDIHGPFDPAFGSDIDQWRDSMQQVLSLEADILCEGHYGVFHPKQAVRDFIQQQLAMNG
jgi:glyoxylase-like metal-dependent hydrolase (beta-lactamase superfamily II)